jgi:hypothetical protein
MTWWPGFDLQQSKSIFPLASVPRPALRPTQTAIKWIPVFISPEVKRGRGVTLTTHSRLLPRSRMSRSYVASPSCPCMAVAEQLCFFYFTFTQHFQCQSYLQRNVRPSYFKHRLCGLVVSVADYKHRGPGSDSRALLRIFLRALGLERGPLSLVIG